MGLFFGVDNFGTFTVPSVVQRVWVSCIGGGGGGGPTNPSSFGYGGGGGGWGYGAVNISSTTINYAVGNGGLPFPLSNGASSFCLGVAGFGGGAGNNNPGVGGGFAGPNGANGSTSPGINGGAAGGVSGSGNFAEFTFEVVGDPIIPPYGQVLGGGGGNGNDGFGGIGPGSDGGISYNFGIGGIGGNWGGGGGGAAAGGVDVYAFGEAGSAGAVYVTWIDLSAGATTLRSGEPTTVFWDSFFDGSGSTTVSYTNTGTTNITQTYTRTDSRGAQSTITFTILPAVRITSFTANPNPQTSGFDGVPNYDTILSWTTTGATSASINQNIGSVEPNDSITITNLPQSVAGVTSPATRTYTLTVSDGFNTDTETLTVEVRNDNTPNNYTISNQINLEPNTFYTINVGSITGIDMITNVICGPEVTVSKNNLDNYVSSITIVNGDSVQLRFRSDPFNTDPTGQPSTPRSLYVDIGTLRRFFTISTRAPDVNEEFNLPDENNRVPFPDIDTISEPSLPYITSDTLSIDDIELQAPSGVEIKTDNPNIQISINGGSWRDVRSI